MKIREADDGSLTVTQVTWWPALVTVGFGAAALEVWFRDPPRRGDAFWSVLIALAALACLAGLEKARFHFDRATRRLTWTRRRLFRQEGGDIPFESIRSLSLEQAFNDDSLRRSNARRVDLHTTGGLIPLTTGYSAGVKSQLVVAEKIRAVLGLESPIVQ